MLFSTKNSIFFAMKNEIVDIRSAGGATSEHKLAKMGLLRGFNNHFFYAEKDKSSETFSVFELDISLKEKENQWVRSNKKIYQASGGKILAIELDRDYPLESDSFWSQEG